MKREERLNGVYSIIHKIGDHIYAILSDNDFGYDGDCKRIYEGELIQVIVALRNQIRDYYVTINIGGICINIWSNDIPDKIFFSKKEIDTHLQNFN